MSSIFKYIAKGIANADFIAICQMISILAIYASDYILDEDTFSDEDED